MCTLLLIVLAVALPPASAATDDAVCKRYRSEHYTGHDHKLGALLVAARQQAPQGRVTICVAVLDRFLGVAADVVSEPLTRREEGWIVAFQREFNTEADPTTVRFFFQHEIGHMVLRHYRTCVEHMVRGDHSAYTACESSADVYAAESIGFCEGAQSLEFLRGFVSRYGASSIADRVLLERKTILWNNANCK